VVQEYPDIIVLIGHILPPMNPFSRDYRIGELPASVDMA